LLIYVQTPSWLVGKSDLQIGQIGRGRSSLHPITLAPVGF
jgi:hypothetical protein